MVAPRPHPIKSHLRANLVKYNFVGQFIFNSLLKGGELKQHCLISKIKSSPSTVLILHWTHICFPMFRHKLFISPQSNRSLALSRQGMRFSPLDLSGASKQHQYLLTAPRWPPPEQPVQAGRKKILQLIIRSLQQFAYMQKGSRVTDVESVSPGSIISVSGWNCLPHAAHAHAARAQSPLPRIVITRSWNTRVHEWPLTSVVHPTPSAEMRVRAHVFHLLAWRIWGYWG